MKDINSLVSDIYELLASGKFHIDAKKLADMIAAKFAEEKQRNNLRMSNFGKPCERQLWYSVNMPETAEPMPPHALLKMMYGHIIEEVVTQLAEQAGHPFEHQQETLEIKGVIGHIDGVVDGRLVDVKSANSRGMEKFRSHRLASDDPFGYLSQLGLYLYAGTNAGILGEPSTSSKGQEDQAGGGSGQASLDPTRTASFIAVDKELGHIVLDTYEFPKKDWDAAIDLKKKMLTSKEPPPRGFFPEPHNKSGNMKLPTPCAYCPHKKTCYPLLRSFLYSTGPVHLTKIVKQPEVQELH